MVSHYDIEMTRLSLSIREKLYARNPGEPMYSITVGPFVLGQESTLSCHQLGTPFATF